MQSSAYVGLQNFLCNYSMFMCDPWWVLRGKPEIRGCYASITVDLSTGKN